MTTPSENKPYSMWRHPSHIIAQGFGSGLSPLMPGTSGTLFAWLVYLVLTMRWPTVFTPSTWWAIIIIGFFVGVWACHVTGKDIGDPDHGSMVWDEIIAFWLVLVVVMPGEWDKQLAAFLVFRFFDMVKPPPIAYFDRHLKGGFGVMWDDIVAAFYTLLVFAIWHSF
jgi:phosphatidylglycerophosphatase A